MHLTFHGARADRPPGDEVGVVLPEGRVQELGRDREPRVRDVGHEVPRGAQALADLVGLVEVGVVDEALPSHHRPRLLEVHAHGDDELARVCFGRGAQERGVFKGGAGVVDRARPGHDEEPVVAPGHDRGDVPARMCDPGGPGVVQRDLRLEGRRRRQRHRRADAKV